MSHTPLTTWPKAFLLEVYAAAVRDGYIYLEPITQQQSASFKASFLRMRRKSDRENAKYIIPEYNLVTVGQWQQHGDDPTLGRLPILYNQLPAGLPSIVPATHHAARPADFSTIAQPTLAPTRLPDPFSQPLQTPVVAPSQDSNFDINSFVSGMKRKIEDDRE